MVTDVEQPTEAIPESSLPGQSGTPSTEDSAGGAQAFDIDGEQVTPEQIKQWKSGFMMQSDYTRKNQELAKQRESLKPYQEMADYLKANPEKGQAVYNYLAGGQQALDSGEIDPRDLKVQQMERSIQSLIVENSRRDAQNRIERIKAEPKYEGIFGNQAMEEMLLAKALQTGDFDLTSTADAIHKVVLDLKANTRLETEKKIRENFQSPTRKGVHGGGVQEPPKGFNPAKASSKELAEKALEMLS